MGRPHVLVIPFPAQGHVIPFLELSQRLLRHGLRVTFVNTDHTQKLIINASQGKKHLGDDPELQLVSIPDGLESLEDRYYLGKLFESLVKVMPGKLEELVQEMNNKEEDEKITCVIADVHVGMVLPVAEKLKINKRAAFLSTAVAALALYHRIPKLIDDGIINKDGTATESGRMIELGANMPTITSAEVVWNFGDLITQRNFFQLIVEGTDGTQMAADYLICNTTCDLEPEAFNLVPKILPIGPLLASNRQGNSAGYFWPEDSTCLTWLDQQQPRSDITEDANQVYPEGFQERVANRGKMVGWAPQQKVLSHPSIACLFSHCGWNSTMEGVSNGLSFLCWPYFADQFINQSYICDIWKVALKFNREEGKIITREEIKTKVDQVLSDENFRARASDLREKTLRGVKEGGLSDKTFKEFIEWIKTQEEE